jgi:hypothetical protein
VEPGNLAFAANVGRVLYLHTAVRCGQIGLLNIDPDFDAMRDAKCATDVIRALEPQPEIATTGAPFVSRD